MKGNEKYIEGLKFISLFIGVVLSYITWMGLGTISNQMFSVFPKVLPVVLLALFILTIPKLSKVDWLFAGGLLLLLAIPAVFYFNSFSYLLFYWQTPLSLVFIFLVGKFSFSEDYRMILLYFTSGYIFIMLFKMLLVTFELGNLVLWINKNLIAGPTFFACMLAIILIDKLAVSSPLLFQGLTSLMGITVFYLCDSWTPMFSFLAFLAVGAGVKYSEAIRQFARKKIVWVILFSAIFLLVPIFIYFLTANDGFGLSFSGRVEIWQELFYSWSGDIKNILIGTQTRFSAARSGLAAHNAYLDTLWSYGIIGYVVLFGGIITLTFRHSQKKYSTNQILCLLAFFVTCIHATMENYLSSFQWIPMIFIFLALFVSQSEEASVLEEETDWDSEEESEAEEEDEVDVSAESDQIPEISTEEAEELSPE